jgi:uncharacterized protein
VIVYLHGFASSAQSSKATFLARKLAGHGITLEIPDFNQPDFSTLTVTRMIEQVGRLIDAAPAAPVTLIGSSLGGFVAVNIAAARPARIERLVLLAPALEFGPSTSSVPSRATSRDGGSRTNKVGETEIAEWKASGRLMVFHYGYGRMLPVHYALYEDAHRYDAFGADIRMPVLVFQGRRDDAVDPATVEAWAAARPNVDLHVLDDDHQLTASLPYIWDVTSRFLGIARESRRGPS